MSMPDHLKKPKDKKKPRAKARPQDGYSEAEIQRAMENLFTIKGYKYFHIPDAMLGCVARNSNFKLKNMVSNAVKGLPDLLVFSPSEIYNHCLLLEVKTLKGKLSQGQINWHKKANVIVTYGMDEALSVGNEFINYCETKESK